MSEVGAKFIPRQPITRTGVFSRATQATYFDRDGLRRTATIDEHRFQFTPVTGSFEGLLLESEAINRCAWSDDFTQSGWTATRVLTIADQRLGADGELSMTKLAATTDNGTHSLGYTFEAAAGQVATVSVDIAAGELFLVELRIAGSVTGKITSAVIDVAAAEVFDPSIIVSMTGLLGTVSSLPGLMLLGTSTADYDLTPSSTANVLVQDLGNGICRVWLSAVMPNTETCTASLWLYQPADGSAYAGDDAMGVYASAFDIRLSTAVDRSSFIPSSGTETTRAADVNAAMMVSSIPEDDYALWDSATSYALADRVMIWDGANYLVFQSVQAANVGHTPLDESTVATAVPTWWQYVGLTNAWRMFDRSYSSVSAAEAGISLALYPTGRIDTLALLNLNNARSVHVRVTHPSIGILYDQTHSLISAEGIDTYSEWFFTPRETITYLVLLDLPFFVGSRVDIDIDGLDEVSCGLCLIGLANTLGGTQWGAEVGIKDYSVKETDEYGNLTITERVFANTGSFQIWVETAKVDRVHRLFEQYRADPILLIGANQYGCTYIYGLYTKYSMLIQYVGYSICSIDIEGVA